MIKHFPLLPFIYISLLGYLSCSSSDIDETKGFFHPQETSGDWFNVDRRFKLEKRDGVPLIHAFFDFMPKVDLNDNSLNVVMITPPDSPFEYLFDLPSGSVYRGNRYCKQSDAWKKYSGNISRPNFGIGVVPRLLDQLGLPQKILVFGNPHEFPKLTGHPQSFKRVRVVGGFVEQFCDKFPCQGPERWLSRFVLLGLFLDDKEYQHIKDLSSLKKEFDWEYVKAFIENSQGRIIVKEEDIIPAFRAVGGHDAEKSLRLAFKSGRVFLTKELNVLRKSCHKLYDYLAQNMKKYLKRIHEKQVFIAKGKEDYLFADMKSEEKNPLFVDDLQGFIRHFYQKFKNEYQSCQKFVYSSNIMVDYERHWPMIFMDGLFKLDNLGKIYSCNDSTWIDNFIKEDGKREYEYVQFNSFCSEDEQIRGFNYIPKAFSSLRKSYLEHYRYIEYDDREGGTHEFIHNWVYDSGKRNQCTDLEKELDMDLFPEDVRIL